VGGGGGSGDGGAAGAEVVERVRPRRPAASRVLLRFPERKKPNAGERREWIRRRSGSTGERFELWDYESEMKIGAEQKQGKKSSSRSS